MSFTRFYYEPFFTLENLFDEAFQSAVVPSRGRHQSNGERSLKPKLDLHEGEDNTVTATFEVPGLKKEDINIELHNKRLTISGETKSVSDRNDDGYVVRERRFGKFSRSLPLPEGIEPEQVKASVADGILTITFPKAGPEQNPKKIVVS